MRARLFPGDGRLWLVAGVVLLAIGLGVFVQLAKPREVLLGSNGVAPRNNASEIGSGTELCVKRVRVPSGTVRVRWSFDTRLEGKPAFRIRMVLWQDPERRGPSPRELTGRLAAQPEADGLRYVDIPLSVPVPDAPNGEERADICVTPVGGSVFPWGNAQSGNSDLPLTADGRAIPEPGFRPTLQFLGPDGTDRAMLVRLGDIFDRMSLFRPAFVGAWTYWLLFLLVLPGLGYGGLRLVAGATRRSVLRTALGIYGVAAAVGMSWALITPSFQSPDESEHFAAVQYFAETGRAVDNVADPDRPVPWSAQEARAIDAARLLPSLESNKAKLPWPAGYERAWEDVNWNDGKGQRRDNGGGYHPATSAHSPAYYALMSPSYLSVNDRSPWAQLLAVRWQSALLSALIAVFAFLAALEVMPGRHRFAAAAGAIVAFQPMAGFMAGAVNNDAGVNVAGAALTYLCLRGLRRGLSWRLGLAIGAVTALAPIMKGTGYELVPPVLFAVGAMLWRGRGRPAPTLAGLAAAGGAGAAVTLAWGSIASTFERSITTTPAGVAPTGVPGLQHLDTYVSWMWQVLVPVYRLPGMAELTWVRWPFFNIYIERGFGSFGWYAHEFPTWVYLVILAVAALLLARGALFLLWQRRDLLRARFAELAFLVLVPVSVVFAVGAAYTNISPSPYPGTPEQGRYGFPALAACAVIAVLCARAFGERRGERVAAGLVAALFGLSIAGQVLMSQRFYA